MSGPTRPEPPSPREELDAAAADTPAELSLRDATMPPPTVVGERFARRTAELATIYQAAIITLAWGFRGGAALLTIGLIAALIRDEPLSARATPFDEVIPALRDGQTRVVVDLAILWFMATPVVTVVMVMIAFARIGDRRYAALSFIVLGILATSIALAMLR